MIAYREFTDLTNEEIKFILNDIFHPVNIKHIKRNKKWNEITAEITTDGWSDGLTENFKMTDEVTLTPNDIQIGFNVDGDDLLKYQQFLLAKGCHYLLKNNPYLTQSH